MNASPFVEWYSVVQVPISGLNTQATCSTTAPGGTDAPLSPDGDCNAANDPAGGTLLVNAGKTRVAGIDLTGRIAPTRTLSFDADRKVVRSGNGVSVRGEVRCPRNIKKKKKKK